MGNHKKISVFMGAFLAVMVAGAAFATVGIPAVTGGGTSTEAGVTSEPATTTSAAATPTRDFIAEVDVRPVDTLPPDWEFTANQRYSIVEDDPAVNGYWGTSRPGSIVVVESEFGRGRTETANDGKWELKVEFSDMPCNEWFKVVASSGDHQQAFRMQKACRDWRFTANQRYEVVDEDPAVNGYWGTSKPGSVVTVESRFGKGRTETNNDGKWELKVEFSNMPCNEPFKVLTSSGDHQQTFEMKKACRPDFEFTAHQTYGECGEPIPYDVFYGTGTPGTVVKVASRFGDGSTTAGADGHWKVKVEFPGAPAGEPFPVIVESSDGGRAEFKFVYTGVVVDKELTDRAA